MRKLMAGAVLVAVLGLGAQVAAAQTAAAPAVRPIQIGVQGDFATNHYGPGAGVRVVFNSLGSVVKVPGLAAYASFDYFFPSSSLGTGLSFYEVNANATYDIKLSRESALAPYIGAGINYAHLSANCAPFSCSATNTGLNILGGAKFKLTQRMGAYAEARFELRTASAIVITAGILF